VRRHIISVSGGKDSTATLLVAIERGIEFDAVFADTGHEHQDVYDYLDYLEDRLDITIKRIRARFAAKMAGKREFIVKQWAKDGVSQERIDRALELLVPTGNPMLDLCLWKGRMPSTKARFCTQELKVIPITTQVLIPALRKYGKVWSWQGVRADESRARAKLPWIDREGDLPGIYNYRPILSWTAEEVFAKHAEHNVLPNPLYKKGMGRVGCLPCVNCRKSELKEIAKRFPEEIERVAHWEYLVSQCAKRGSTTWFPSVTHSREDRDISYQTHGIDKAVEWSKTLYGGRQYDLLEDTDDLPSCSSMYGLCE